MNANQPIIITVKLSRETKNTTAMTRLMKTRRWATYTFKRRPCQAVPRQSWSFS